MSGENEPMNRELPFHVEMNQRTANQASYILLALMMVCVSISWSQLMVWVMPRWVRLDAIHHSELLLPSRWDFLPFLVFLISLEAIFSRSIARELEGRERFIYHFAEWITIAFAVKICLYLMHGFDLLPPDLARWENNFLYFFEGEYFLALFIVAFLWGVCRVSCNNIDALNIEPEDLTWDLGLLQNNRTAVRTSLVNRLLWTGTLMVIMAAGSRSSIAWIGDGVAVQAPVINVLVYFFLALVLFSQTQHALLHSRWFWHEIPVHPRLTKRWIRYSILLFAILAVIAFLLPTNYSMGLLETMNYLFNLIFYFGSILIQLLLFPLIWLLSISGCMRQPEAQPTPEPILPPPPSAPAQPAAVPLPWLQLLQSILFWMIFIGIITYAILMFVRQNPRMFSLVERIRVFRVLGTFWDWLRGLFRGAGRQIAASIGQIQERLNRMRPQLKLHPAGSWFNFRQLSPRQQIIFYYLRLVERGGEQGIFRRQDQTPTQYAETLQSSLPEVEDEIEGITRSFIEARYSLHAIEPERSSLVQRFWRDITRSLRGVKKTGSSLQK